MATFPGPFDDDGSATEVWIYRLAMESLPDTVFVAGLDGTLQWVCPNVTEIFGITAEEVLATETVESLLGAELVAPDGVESAVKPNLPAVVVDADGVEHALLVTVKPLAVEVTHHHGEEAGGIDVVAEPSTTSETDDQEPGALLYACRDITARTHTEAELAESESRFQALFEGTLDALVLADDEGRYLDVNPAACELYGLPRTELVGKTVAEFAPPEFDFDAAWTAFLEDGKMRGEFELHRPDGAVRIADFVARANIRPGEHLSVLRDVTERVERERQVEAQRDELAHLDRINRLVRVVNRALIGANTRTEVFSDVCTQLVDAEVYHHALVVTEVAAGQFEVTAAAGLSEREAAAVVDTVHGELEAATDRRTPVIAHSPPDREVGVVGCFPLEYEGTMHGILLIETREKTGVPALGPGEQHALDDLGTTVAKAVTAVSARQLLNVDETTRLEFVVDDGTDVFNVLSRRLNATVTVTGVVPTRDSRHACYVHVASVADIDRDTLVSRVDGIEPIESCRVMTGDGTLTLELLVAGGSPALTLETQGAHILRLSSTEGAGELVLEVPTESNVRSLISRVRDDYPEVRLVRKFTERRLRDRVGGIGGRKPTAPPTDVSDTLTEKQLAALRAAYAGGYYDWPRRGSSAQELAATLGIAPATYHQHLRAAQRKLVDAYFSS